MTQLGNNYAVCPQGTYIVGSSTDQVTAYQNLCGQKTEFPDVDISAGTVTVNSTDGRLCVFVQNDSGLTLTPGMALNWVSGYWGTHVQACPAGSAARCYAPSYVNGSTSTTIPDQAFFWAVYHGSMSPLSDGTAIAINDGLVVGAASGKVCTERPLGGGLLYASTAASTAISNTVTATAFDKSYTFPANSLKAGDVIRVRAEADITWNSGQLTLQLLIGSTVVATTGAITNATGDAFVIDGEIEIRTAGASGTVIGSGVYVDGILGGVSASAVAGATAHSFVLASTTIDTTATQAITLKATWSAANSGNSVVLNNLEIQRVNTSSSALKSGIAKAAASAGSAVQFRAAINCTW